MNADYVRIAHRRAAWAELQRLLLDLYLSADGAAKRQIICEEVFYADKEVTQEALIEVMEELQQHEQDERLQMSQYEFKRRASRRSEDDRKDSTPAASSEGTGQADQAGPGVQPGSSTVPPPVGGGGAKSTG